MKQKWYVASGYGDGKNPDILLFVADGCGRMEKRDALVQGDCPSFLCAAGERIFAASERSDKAVITSYRIEGEKLYKEHVIEFPGKGLCHLAADGQMLYAGCYLSGEWYVIDQELKQVYYVYREGTHIHWSTCIGGQALLVTDLGQDLVLRFSIKDGVPENKPEKFFMKKGCGPRQAIYDDKNHKVVVINELDSTIAFGNGIAGMGKPGLENPEPGKCGSEKPDAGKKWEPEYRNATQRKYAENYPGGAWQSDDNKLFVANRGADTIAVFDMENDFCFLGEWDCRGCWPRYLYGADSKLIFAACQKSNAIQSFVWQDNRLQPADSLPLTGASCMLAAPYLR